MDETGISHPSETPKDVHLWMLAMMCMFHLECPLRLRNEGAGHISSEEYSYIKQDKGIKEQERLNEVQNRKAGYK